MAEFESGMVVVYSYLWAREFDRGEESGRKDRPVCVQLIVQSAKADSGFTQLFVPITSQPPVAGRAVLEIPHLECQRAGLRTPAWIVVDEFNIDETSPSVHLRSMKPLGAFSQRFTAEIRKRLLQAVQNRNYRSVPRRK